MLYPTLPFLSSGPFGAYNCNIRLHLLKKAGMKRLASKLSFALPNLSAAGEIMRLRSQDLFLRFCSRVQKAPAIHLLVINWLHDF